MDREGTRENSKRDFIHQRRGGESVTNKSSSEENYWIREMQLCERAKDYIYDYDFYCRRRSFSGLEEGLYPYDAKRAKERESEKV